MQKINLLLLFFCFALWGCPDNPDPLTSKEYAEMNCSECTLTYTARSALIRQLIDKRDTEIEQGKAKLAIAEKDRDDWRFAREQVTRALTNCHIERDGCQESLTQQPVLDKKIVLIKPITPNLQWVFSNPHCLSPDAYMWCP